MWFAKKKSLELPTAADALPGRDTRPFRIAERHVVLDTPLEGPYPEGAERVLFGMGCFWGAERRFWEQKGVITTAAGYAGGTTPNPTYGEVCTGMTGHNEVVLVVYDPAKVGFAQLLKVFFESHDPTQGMRQGNDVGTQYRSGIYTTTPEQLALAKATAEAYGAALAKTGGGPITTEIMAAPAFYFAEDDHQQYLAKNPWGYCGLRGTGIACAVPATAATTTAPMTAA
jgi:peptide-methionine (S)-S-oxide reductase